MSLPDLTDSDTPAPGRTRRNRGSEIIRAALLTAATEEFAANGFDGASTRRIAERAEAHQSQIKYHFDTKEELWRRCIERLLEELDNSIAASFATVGDDPSARLEATIRGLVHFMAQRPELNRIMMQEATSTTDRLIWLVDTHIGRRHASLRKTWVELVEQGAVAPVDPDLVYHLVIGAASLLYSNAPEADLLGIRPSDPDLIERHADTLVALLLRPSI
ncbi:MAG: TetR/AcrR family transcriptional regulator [Actinomycetota bacterium]